MSSWNSPQRRRRAGATLAVVAAIIAVDVAALHALGVLTGNTIAVLAVAGACVGLLGAVFRLEGQREHWPIEILVGILLVVVPIGLGYSQRPEAPATVPYIPITQNPNVVGMSGGCKPYAVWGQNRWEPYGAKVLARPLRAAKQVGGVAPNKMVYVDGWVRTESGNLTDSPPWNSDIWFHLADGTGWMSFAGSRGAPTAHDPTGGYSRDGGIPAPHPAKCRGALS